MNNRFGSQGIAMALLVLAALSVVVGVVNSARLPERRESGLFFNAAEKHHLALIEVAGPIVMDGPQQAGGLFSSDSMAVTARKALDKAAKDDAVKGVLLRIDSPGGTVGMSQELNAAVQRVRKVKPVVATLGDMAASGGYYTAVAADRIFANPGTLTASIGVIISTINVKGLLTDKLGVKSLTIKSGAFKDILSPYREARPEEINLIQRLIDESYQQFIGAVIAGRTRNVTDPAQKQALITQIKSVADGRVVIGTEAKVVGLVDEIGDIMAARDALAEMARKRFNLSADAELPLEEAKGGSVLEALGLSSQALIPRQQTADALTGWMPVSLRYPNQPLWILE